MNQWLTPITEACEATVNKARGNVQFCFTTLLQNGLNETKRLQGFFSLVGGKTGNVAVQLALQPCYRTSYRFFCHPFYPTLNFKCVGQHNHVADGLVWQFCPSYTCISNPDPWQCRQSCLTFWSFQLYWAEKKSRPYVESRKLSSTWPNTGTEWLTYGQYM